MSSTQPEKKGGIVHFLINLFWFIVIVLFIRGTLIEAFKIPSGSMIPTLRIGDHLLVSKLSYGLRLPFVSKMLVQWSEPRRGSIVVFTRPDDPDTAEYEPNINVIKRVIALPGEIVEVRGTQVLINNLPLNEPYARWKHNGLMEGYFGPAKVPEGKVLLLGDNRDESRDSRFWPDPFLPIELIKGKALIIYWSFDDLARIGTIIR